MYVTVLTFTCNALTNSSADAPDLRKRNRWSRGVWKGRMSVSHINGHDHASLNSASPAASTDSGTWKKDEAAPSDSRWDSGDPAEERFHEQRTSPD